MYTRRVIDHNSSMEQNGMTFNFVDILGFHNILLDTRLSVFGLNRLLKRLPQNNNNIPIKNFFGVLNFYLLGNIHKQFG